MNDLLEKYWNGQTSLQEEQQLRAYFSSDNVAIEHEIYLDIFETFSEECEQKQPHFNAFARIPEEPNESSIDTWKSLKRVIVAAAAVVVFAFIGAYFSTNNDKLSNTDKDLGTYETPEEAYQATLNALQLVGTNLNNGKKNLKPLNDLDHKTKQVFSIANP